MLSPSSPVQKSLGEEESSGSDAGSEAGLEPETDRFGFIVTNGSTAGSVGPPPELVRQREAKWISIILQWDSIVTKRTSKIKVQCQKGIPASLRAKCWPLLCGATNRMKQNQDLYQSLDSQTALQSWVDIIERDLDRQFPFHEMFISKDGHGQRGLFRVLKAYTQYKPEEGYCQAQGPVAAVLLMNMPAEEAFWCLVQISEQYLPGYYSPLLEGVLFDAAILTWVLKRTCPSVHKHLQHHGVEPLMFATDWLMCLFTRHLPFNTLLRVWDLFFCYGVRVLLQVAVVLVRRVLGRAEQRKQCQGQMETLERLRGVREEVQYEDDAFIAEVCSVPLSKRDLEKQTEKELEKWRQDKPSSTFDPRGRCQGYRMAWTRAQQHVEELDRKEREKGNLSVPLARSASTLSLSPSILHKKWRKGGKVNAGESVGGNKVVRHLSMGAKEDCRGWTDFNFKRVQGVQEEDVIPEDFNKQSETKLSGQTEQREPEDIQNDKAVTKTVKEQTGEEAANITEKEKDQSQQIEETNVESEPSTGPTKEQIENIAKEGENVELLTDDQSKGMDQQSDNNEVNEVRVSKKETENDEAVSQSDTQQDSPADPNTEVEMEVSEEQVVQAEVKSEECTEIENVQEVDTATEDTEVSKTVTEEILDAETDSQVDVLKDPPREMETLQQKGNSETETDSQVDVLKDPPREMETLKQEVNSETVTDSQVDVLKDAPRGMETLQQGGNSETETNSQVDVLKDPPRGMETLQQEGNSETDNIPQGAEFEGRRESTESLPETEMKESHTQPETDTCVVIPDHIEDDMVTQDQSDGKTEQTDIEQPIDSQAEAEALIPCYPEHTQGPNLVSEAEVEAVSNTGSESRDAVAQHGQECDTGPSEEREGSSQIAQVDSDQTKEERPPEANTESIAPPQEAEVILSAQPVGNVMSSEEKNSAAESAPEEPEIEAGVEEQENSECVREISVEEDNVFISAEPAEFNSDSNPKVQESELSKWGPSQGSSRRSSRSSGDFCIRKSSNSRGARIGRRLSQDFFTEPQKSSQSQSVPSQPEHKHTESGFSPGAVRASQTSPEATPEVTSLTDRTQQEPTDPRKRFALFRRQRGEQSKKPQAKGTPKMQVPKILIQDFSDGLVEVKPVEGEHCEKLSSRERRRRRRERERQEKEEKLRKKKEKEQEKEKERERRKAQMKGKGFQAQKEKGSSNDPAKTGSQTLRSFTSYTESYF